MKKLISILVMSTIAGALLGAAPGAQAKPAGGSADTLAQAVAERSDYSAYRGRQRGYRGGGNVAAGAAIAGVAGALIGGAIAAQSRPAYGYYDAPAYGYEAVPAYGYRQAPAYGYYDAPGYEIYEDED